MDLKDEIAKAITYVVQLIPERLRCVVLPKVTKAFNGEPSDSPVVSPVQRSPQKTITEMIKAQMKGKNKEQAGEGPKKGS